MFSIIPAKPWHESKTRLTPVLSLSERVSLSRHLLQRTIRLAGQVSEVVVISRDAEVRRLAKQAGAWALVEAGTDLNGALRQAAAWVAARGGEAAFILPGDLPQLDLSDLTKMIELGDRTPAVVIAPCQRWEGTNGLLLRPVDVIEFAFGPGSFAKHQRAAQALGIEPVIYSSPTLALDLDWPADLAAWRHQPCEKIG